MAIPAAATGKVDLDTLKITTFSEGADEFLEFKASFEATVCLKYSSPTLRMLYLKMYLRPPAANLIKGYRNDEFDAAWIVLKEKYGEREEYIRYLHNRLATISACHRPNDFNKFVVELNQILHKLSSAGEDVSGPQTFLQLERKLPKFVVRKILEKKAATPGWTTEKMRMALNEISKTENDVSNIVSIDDPEISEVFGNLRSFSVGQRPTPKERVPRNRKRDHHHTRKTLSFLSMSKRQKSKLVNQSKRVECLLKLRHCAASGLPTLWPLPVVDHFRFHVASVLVLIQGPVVLNTLPWNKELNVASS